VARHRTGDEGFGDEADPTEVMPAIGPDGPRRGTFTASPLLLAAGGVALALVFVVGAWALTGGRGDDDPLVYPWSSQTPGQIDVSISLEPTGLPTAEPTPVIEATGTADPSATASGPVSATPTPSTSVPKSGGVAATIGLANTYSGGYVVHFTVANNGPARVSSWRMEIWFTENFELADYWNASNPVKEPRHIVLTSVRALDPGTNVDVGIRAGKQGSNLGTPVSCTIDGRSFPCVPKWTS
jgi:hypothetical protein